MRTVKNVKRRPRVMDLAGRKSALHLPGRAKAVLTEKEFQSPDVQRLIRGGYLKEIGGK